MTYALDRAADANAFSLPSWVNTGGTDAARTILTTIAAAAITVVGVVFSITILALQLASTQFGPGMLRNFIRDRGTQLTLGIFVATFVFSVLALGSVSNKPSGEFVPHISVSVAILLLLVDLGVVDLFQPERPGAAAPPCSRSAQGLVDGLRRCPVLTHVGSVTRHNDLTVCSRIAGRLPIRRPALALMRLPAMPPTGRVYLGFVSPLRHRFVGTVVEPGTTALSDSARVEGALSGEDTRAARPVSFRADLRN